MTTLARSDSRITTTLTSQPFTDRETVIASYPDHATAEEAVRQLASGGLPVQQISIVGRNYETHEDIQGFYRPSDAIVDGARQGAWFGGIFGLLMGATGFFVFPVIGSLLILGPLASLVAGAIGGAGVGALTSSLIQMGIPQEEALKYQARLQAGEFLVVLHGTAHEATRAHEILSHTLQVYLQTHQIRTETP